jgi:hypothetical protein
LCMKWWSPKCEYIQRIFKLAIGQWAEPSLLMKSDARWKPDARWKRGCLVMEKPGCLMMAPKGDIARRTMSVCTQQCMAVFWVRKRYTTCDMWMLIYRWYYANRSCMNMLDWHSP